MPNPKKVPFEVQPSEPMQLVVTGADGKKYRLSLQMAIVEVIDKGLPQIRNPTLPTFEVKAQMIAETFLAEGAG